MTDGLEYLGRARMQGLLLLLLAFLVGALAGAAGDRLLSRRPPPEPPAQGPGEGAQGRPRLPRVLEEMDLTPAQRSAIDSVLASGRPRNEVIMNEVMPRLRAVSDSLHQGIRAVLTPAQAAEFDAYLRSQRGRMRTPPPPREGSDDRSGGEPRRDRRPGEESRERRPPPPPDGDPSGRRPPPPPEGSPPPPPPGDRR